MKKLLTFFLTALLAFAVGWAETVTFVAGTDTSEETSITKDGITVTLSSGVLNRTDNYRPYSGSTTTVSSASGNITSIEFTCTGSGTTDYGPGKFSLASGSTGNYTYNGTVGTWTGSASSVSFSASAQLRITQIVVTTSSGGSGGGETGLCNATIAFKSGTGTYDASGAMTSNTIDGNVESGSNYISSFSDFSRVYLAKSGYGWKMAGSNNNGYFTVNLATQSDGWKVTKIVVNACRYSATEGSIRVYTNINTSGTTFDLTANDSFTDYEATFDGSDISSFSITTLSGKRAYVKSVTLYLDCEENTDPTLSVSPSTLTLTDIPYDGNSTSGTFTVTGANLENNVSMSVSGADFSVSPTSITPTDGAVNQQVTVTYSGTSTTAVTGTVTVTCGDLSETVTVTAKKETPPPPVLTVSPATLTINDSGTGNSFTVTGSNLGTDNVGVTVTNSNFTPSVSATVGTTYSYENGTYRGFTPANGSVAGTVTIDYTGRELSASDVVSLGTNVNGTQVSAAVTVNYVPDLYIITDNGQNTENGYSVSGWDYTNGTSMTNNDGVYTGTFTADLPNTYIVFARKLGESNPWNTRYLFGPVSTATSDNPDANWFLPQSGNGNGTLDLNSSHCIKIQTTGTFIITIDANAGTFTITKETAATGDFSLVTDVSQLVAGAEVIVVNRGTAGTGRTMGQRNSNNYYGTEVEVSSTLKVTATQSTQIFTLEAGTGGWYFKTSDNLYLNNMNSGTSNNLQTKGKDANGTNTSLATIAIENNNVATIVFQGASNRNNLRYNANNITTNPSNNDYFSCYLASSQANVYLYIRESGASITVDPSSLEMVIPAGGTSVQDTVAVTENNTTGTTSVAISGTGASHFSATLTNGELIVTYNGTATQDTPDEATITLTNGEATATVTVTGYKLPMTVTITPASATFSGSTMSGITIESNVAGASLEYSLDGGTTWLPYSGSITVTAASVGQQVTVQARATYNGETATTSATYTRVAKSNTLFEKVTTVDQIHSGNKYVLVYEDTPEAMNGITTGGTGVAVQWHGTNVVDVASTNAIQFTLTGSASSFTLSYVDGGTTYYLSPDAPGLSFGTESTNWSTEDNNSSGYVLKWGNYMMRYNTGASAANGRFRIYDGTTGTPVYLYVQGGMIQAPEIMPESGTYYESQTVSISDESDDVTIWYTTDGTDPATSATRQQYTGQFTAPYVPGTTTTIIAVAIDEEDNVSEPATVTYTWGVPTAVIAPASGNVATSTVTVAITGTPAEATIYYTTDGTTPTTSSAQYSAPFTVNLPDVGDEVTVQAIAVYNGQTSEVATATYTRVEKVIDVNAPFFSPLQNLTYYGDQTLQMASTTPNADVYFEIIEVAGEEAPSAAYVTNPTNVSTHYGGQTITMREGYSYYVKAIAYVGDFHSTISEGWYTILDESDFTGSSGVTYVANCAEFNALQTTGDRVCFMNPVQVVYHSTYANNGSYSEFCYVRDNTDYACIYFGKRNTSNYSIFKMGDWIDGSQIEGEINIWENNFHNQLGTSTRHIYNWPSTTLGWSEIIPEKLTNDVIVSGTAEGDNVWGHYVHLRNTTLRNVTDYDENDPKHTGLINDRTADAYYYDKFYRWSAGTCTYNSQDDVINHLGDYDQAFFSGKQNAGATFDVYGIVDYFKPYTPPFEICPIDFLWIYKPVISPVSNDQCEEPFTATITVAQPEWSNNTPTIYYKTNEMEDWAEYTPGQQILVNSTTTIQAYAEIPAVKSDGTNYNDYIRSLTDTVEYVFPAVADPEITPQGETYDVNVTSSVEVTVSTSEQSGAGTVTYYTTDGSDPRTSETRIELTSENGTFTVDENTTVQAVSCLELNGHTIWSNVVSETYQFIENDDKVYDLLKTAPVVGNIYVIVNKADNVGLSTTQNATNRAATGVMYVDPATKEKVMGNSHLATFVLEAATAGRYYLRELGTQNYLCVTTNDNPNLMTGQRSSYAEAAVSVNSSVTSGVDESYPATVMMSYDGTHRYMRYYSVGRTFTTYDAATTNQDIFLYGLAAAQLLPPSITPGDQLVQVVTGDEHVDATISTNYGDQSTRTVYTTDGSDPRYSATAIELDDPAIILGYINTNTTVRAASFIEYGDDVIWSDVVKATYTFIGIKEPIITPASGLFADGTTVNVTVSTNPQNSQEGVTTYYTTDGSDPRTGGTPINGNSTTLPVTGNTTVSAASCVVVDGQTLWSIVVSETYEFTTPTPLSVIEKSGVKNNDYIVADELIGTWAVVDGNTQLLWAKDQDPYEANDLRPGKTSGQGDYVKDLLKYQNESWDESNWVVLDFGGVTMSPEDFVGQKIKPATIVGKYTDDENFTIKLAQNPVPNGTVTSLTYTGWTENFEPVGQYYDRSYNTYVPANFMAEGDDVNNLNRIDQETGFVVGAVAGNFALAGCRGDSLYFVNPKIQEVARIWGVWNGNDQFTIYYVGRDTVDNKVTNINAWDLKGCFNVVWDYNRVNLAYEYHKPNHLVVGEAYEFHAAIMKPVPNGSKRTKPTADSDTDASSNYELYPLDMSDDPIPTAVHEIGMAKTVIGVSYFNLMGQESRQPFEGINIVVTRYSDGSTSAVKILR